MSYSYDKRVASPVKLKDISEIARKTGIAAKYYSRNGNYIAKISAEELLRTLDKRKNGKMVLMTSITPTPWSGGKTVNTIALSMAINKLKKKSIACICQPSLGPLFGIKGGSSGGGYAQVLPYDEVNLYLSGDTSAAVNAQNLCASFVDNSLFWDNKLGLDKDNITLKRVQEISDRAVRNITIGGGGKLHGVSRKTGIEIAPESECMDILSLSSDLKEMRKRIGDMVVAFDKDGKPVTSEKVKAAGAMAVIMKRALDPNLVQTIEHTPCFVHTSSFANTSHGSSSVISDKLALKLSDYAISDSGFGADLGAEKFINIKCRQSKIKPDVIVVNCSVRALKIHSGDFIIKNTGTVPAELKKENLSAVDRGCSNLEKHMENLKMFGVPIVVCINRFDSDTKKELDIVIRRAEALEADGIAISDAYKEGSKGAMDLAQAVMKAADAPSKLRYLYPVDLSIKNKIERIAKSVYGASEVKYSDTALADISRIEKAGMDQFPVSMAKTHLSLSNNPVKKGRPRGFKLTVDEVRLKAGAGYIVAICDGANTMPGLPNKPAGRNIDVDVKTGEVKGFV